MKRKKARLPSALAIQLVGNGSIAGPEREGVNIPVLIVDASAHPEVVEVLEAAKYEPDGDVTTVWGEDRKNHNRLLHVKFVRPVATELVIVFNMPGEGILVDGILEARCFYLKAGRPTDTFKSTFGDPSILVDVPSSEFNQAWPAIFRRSMMEELRRRGLGYKEALKGADEVYQKNRALTTLRVSPLPNTAPDQVPTENEGQHRDL